MVQSISGQCSLRRVAVIAARRPGSLERVLHSYRAHARERGRELELLVVDAAGDDESLRATEAVVAANAGDDVAVFLLTREDKQQLTRELARRGIDHALLEFALFGARDSDLAPPGANRNAALLACAGMPFLCGDDDNPCVPAPAPGAAAGLVARADDPTDLTFASSLAEALAARDAGPGLLEAHEQALGASLGELETELGPARVVQQGAHPWFVDKLAHRDARVIATATGFRGDAATSSPLYLLAADRRGHGGHLDSEALYRAAWAERCLTRSAAQLTIGDGHGWLPGVVGYDGSALVPPFFPLFRGEGQVFGATIRHGMRSYVAYLPITVEHAPEPRRPGFVRGDVERAATSSPTAHLVELLIARHRPDIDGDDDANLVALGDHLGELGRLPAAEFTALARDARDRRRRLVETSLARALDRRRGAPAWWAADVQLFLRASRTSVGDDWYGVPDEYRQSPGVPDAMRELQGHVASFGALLGQWPSAVQCARELDPESRRGRRPA